MSPIDNAQRSNQQEKAQFKWNGIYRGLVIDTADPRLLGRVKVRIPDLMPEQGGSYTGDWKTDGLWAHPANNSMGGRNVQDTMGVRCDYDDAWYQGSCLIPPKGSWVFLFFETGDPNHPYYFAAGDYGQCKVLPECQQGSEYWKKWVLYKTRKGRCIVMSDDEDDCRVEITGKKRLIHDEPNGDYESVYQIDDNMTTILIDERDGEEKLMLKDYRGNYITMHTKDSIGTDQLDMYFAGDINIEAGANINIKTGQEFNVDAGTSHRINAGTSIESTATLRHSETALSFDRLSYTLDSRTALLSINDTAGISMKQTAGIINTNLAGISSNLMSGVQTSIRGGLSVAVDAALEVEQCNMASVISPLILPALPSMSARIADVIGDRNQFPMSVFAPTPPVPIEDMIPPISIDVPPVIVQDYKSAVGAVSDTPIFLDKELPDYIPPLLTSYTPSPTPPSNDGCICDVGIGHAYALCLKKKYLDTIVPLIDKSYGTYTGFYAFKNYSLNTIDYEFIDPDVVPVYDNYQHPTRWAIDTDDKWWTNLYDYAKSCSAYNITMIPSLLDFADSPTDPYLNYLENPYQFDNWDSTIQGVYLKNLVDILNSTGVEYILNLGVRDYGDDMPRSGYLRNMIFYLVDTLGVSSNKLSLSTSLYDKNPYCNFRTVYDDISPSVDQINIEEKVDGEYGGTGRVSVYDDGELIDGYVKYILDSDCDGIPCMNMWKMKRFEHMIPCDMDMNDPNIMNYIFAPNQREAMRFVLNDDPNNDGMINF